MANIKYMKSVVSVELQLASTKWCPEEELLEA